MTLEEPYVIRYHPVKDGSNQIFTGTDPLFRGAHLWTLTKYTCLNFPGIRSVTLSLSSALHG
jgi:hypothetical protein